MTTTDKAITPNNKLFEHHQLQIDAGQVACRLDKYLMERLPNVTRTKVQLAIKHGFIIVNEKPTKPSYKVQSKDLIKVVLPTPPRTTTIEPENIPLSILYEDQDLLIINKPAGMVVHPGYNNWTGTLANALVYHFQHLPEKDKNNIGRPGIVHRIDKNTSGTLVIAKTEASMTALAKQFYNHSIMRVYYALVWGIPKKDEGTIQINIGRSIQDRRIMTTFSNDTIGKNAITHYKVIKKLHYVSLLQCQLETGRTHQIRSHMQYLGHPIFNDAVYGGDRIVKGTIFSKYKTFVKNCFNLMPRQALHAKSIGFIHPTTQKSYYIESELPDDFQAVIKKWERYVQYTDC